MFSGRGIFSTNVARREMSNGQKAMWVAFLYPETDKGGRGKKSEAAKLTGSGEFNQQRLSEARFVKRVSEDLTKDVLAGAYRRVASKNRIVPFMTPLGVIEQREGEGAYDRRGRMGRPRRRCRIGPACRRAD